MPSSNSVRLGTSRQGGKVKPFSLDAFSKRISSCLVKCLRETGRFRSSSVAADFLTGDPRVWVGLGLTEDVTSAVLDGNEVDLRAGLPFGELRSINRSDDRVEKVSAVFIRSASSRSDLHVSLSWTFCSGLLASLRNFICSSAHRNASLRASSRVRFVGYSAWRRCRGQHMDE